MVWSSSSALEDSLLQRLQRICKELDDGLGAVAAERHPEQEAIVGSIIGSPYLEVIVRRLFDGVAGGAEAAHGILRYAANPDLLEAVMHYVAGSISLSTVGSAFERARGLDSGEAYAVVTRFAGVEFERLEYNDESGLRDEVARLVGLMRAAGQDGLKVFWKLQPECLSRL